MYKLWRSLLKFFCLFNSSSHFGTSIFLSILFLNTFSKIFRQNKSPMVFSKNYIIWQNIYGFVSLNINQYKLLETREGLVVLLIENVNTEFRKYIN
jgi:hypothetical protein